MQRFIHTIIATLLLWVSTAQALFFYIEGTNSKCFYEELPNHTLVVGTYRAEAFNPNTQQFHVTGDLAITVTVEEVFRSDHRVVSQTSQSSDKVAKFTFTAADSGLHRLCFTPQGPAAGHYKTSSGVTIGGTKLTLDMAIGESSKIESDDKEKIDSISSRVQELNNRIHDIRKEQIYQREREAQFRDQSEATNAKIVRWTLFQLVVLGVTCAWQLSHLRSFFIKQKLT